MIRRHPFLALCAAAILLAGILLTWFLATFDLNHYRLQLQQRLSSSLQRPVTLGAAHLSYQHGLVLAVSALEIGPGTSNRSSLSADHLLLALELRPLIAGEVRLREIRLQRPRLILDLARGDASSSAADGSPSLPGRLLAGLGVARCTLIDGTVQLSAGDHPGWPELTLTDLRGEFGQPAPDQPSYLTLEGDLLQGPSRARLAVTATLSPPGADQPLQIHLLGTASNLAPDPLLASWLPAAAQGALDGHLDLNLRLDGAPATALHFAAEIDDRDCTWTLPGGSPAPLPALRLQLSGSWQQEPGRHQLKSLRLTLGELALQGAATFSRPHAIWQVSGELSSAPLAVVTLRSLLADQPLPAGGAALIKGLTGGELQLDALRFAAPLPELFAAKGDPPVQYAALALRDSTFTLDQNHALEEMNLQVVWDRQALRLEGGTFRLRGSPLTVSGQWPRPWSSPAGATLDIGGALPAGELLTYLPAATRRAVTASGPLPLTVSLRGEEQRWQIDMNLDLQPATLAWDQVFAKPAGEAGSLFFTGDIDSEGFELSHSTLHLGPLQLRGQGHFAWSADRPFRLEIDISDFDLQMASQNAPLLQKLKSRGRLSLRYALQGDRRGITQRGGRLFLREVGLSLGPKLAALSRINGEIRLGANDLGWEKITGQLGVSAISIAGALKDFSAPRIELDLSAKTLRADELIFPSETARLRDVAGHLVITPDRVVLERARVRLDQGTEATVIGTISDFSSPKVHLNIEADYGDIDEVIALWHTAAEAAPPPTTDGNQVDLRILAKARTGRLGPLQFTNAQGEITLDNGILAIRPLSFESGPGRFRGQVLVDRSSGPPPLLRISGHLADFDAALIYRDILKRRGLISGRLGGDFYLEGRAGATFVETAQGGFSLVVDEGVLHQFKSLAKVFSLLNVSQILTLKLPDMAQEGMPFERIKASIRLHQGLLSSEDLFLDGPAMNLSVVGSLDLRREELNLLLGVKPLRTVDKIVTSIPLAGWILTGEEKALITAHFQVTGSTENPSVYPVPITSLSEKTVGIFKRVLGLPGKLVTDLGKLVEGSK